MNTLDILDGFRAVIVATPGMVSGYRGVPEKAPTEDKLPAGIAYIDYEREGTVTHGNVEDCGYPVRVDLLVKRKGDLQNEEQAAIPLLEAFIAALRKHTSLFDAGFVFADATWSIQQLNLYNAIYVGASWRGMAGTTDDVVEEIEP